MLTEITDIENDPEVSTLSENEHEDDHDADDEYCEPSAKIPKINPWNPTTLTILDRTMITDTAASAMLTATVVGLGLDSKSVASSRSSIHRYREKVNMFVHHI